MSKVIFVADDDIIIRHIIKSFLEKEGFAVECFENGDLLFSAYQQNQCDLVILDVIMPGSDGFMVGAKIRQVSNLPIIILTSKESDDDYVFGISLGIDAYLTKPFSPAKLIAHVRSLLVKAEFGTHINPGNKYAEVSFAGVILSTENFTVHANDNDLHLTKTEFNTLKFLIENKERAISREEMMSKIWGSDSCVNARATDDTIKRLRRKLNTAESNVSIDTVWGFGFRLSVKNGDA